MDTEKYTKTEKDLSNKIELNFKLRINDALLNNDIETAADYTYNYSQYVMAEINMFNLKNTKEELNKLYIVKNKKKAEGDMSG